MANLMQLGNEFENILELIKTNEGEVTPEIDLQLSLAEQAIVGKVDNIGYYLRTKEKEIDVLKEFETSAKNHRSVIEADLKGFKVWLARAVRTFGNAEGYSSKVLAGNVVKIKDISKDVLTMDDDLIIDDYRRVTITLEMTAAEFETINKGKGAIKKLLSTGKTSTSLDTAKIQAAVAAGEVVQGVASQMKFNTQLLGLKKLDKEVSNG